MSEILKQINEYLQLQLVPKTIVEPVHRGGKVFYRRRTIMVRPEQLKNKAKALKTEATKIGRITNIPIKQITIYSKILQAWPKVTKDDSGFASIAELADIARVSSKDISAALIALRGKYPNQIQYNEDKTRVKFKGQLNAAK